MLSDRARSSKSRILISAAGSAKTRGRGGVGAGFIELWEAPDRMPGPQWRGHFARSLFRERDVFEQSIHDAIRRDAFGFGAEIREHSVTEHGVGQRADVVRGNMSAAC